MTDIPTKKRLAARNTFAFFNKHLKALNVERIKLRNANQIATYASTHQGGFTKGLLLPVKPMGYMSFMINYTRLLTTIGLMIEHKINPSCSDQQPLNRDYELYLNVLNDAVWGTFNLVEFFWWSFKVSKKAGYWGMQLEALGLCIDLFQMIIRHYKAYQLYQKRLQEVPLEKQADLRREWQFKQLHFMRTCIYISLFIITMMTISILGAGIPLSPIFFIMRALNGLLRYTMEKQEHQAEISALKAQGASESVIQSRQRALQYDELTSLHQLLGSLVLLPVCLYLLATMPPLFSIPFAMMALGIMVLVYKAIESARLPSQSESPTPEVVPQAVTDDGSSHLMLT